VTANDRVGAAGISSARPSSPFGGRDLDPGRLEMDRSTPDASEAVISRPPERRAASMRPQGTCAVHAARELDPSSARGCRSANPSSASPRARDSGARLARAGQCDGDRRRRGCEISAAAAKMLTWYRELFAPFPSHVFVHRHVEHFLSDSARHPGTRLWHPAGEGGAELLDSRQIIVLRGGETLTRSRIRPDDSCGGGGCRRRPRNRSR
jgi:hypothetical protein